MRDFRDIVEYQYYIKKHKVFSFASFIIIRYESLFNFKIRSDSLL
jgi:hypothetical protein